MPLLRNGQWADNSSWIKLEDNGALPTTSGSESLHTFSLQRFLELDNGQDTVSGVWLKSSDDVRLLANKIDQIQLIVIDFPTFTDGRGYTQARVLREQLQFSGELRATGDIRPDQILFMARAGIDAFDFSDKPDEKLVKGILSRFTVNYQPSYTLPIAG